MRSLQVIWKLYEAEENMTVADLRGISAGVTRGARTLLQSEGLPEATAAAFMHPHNRSHALRFIFATN